MSIFVFACIMLELVQTFVFTYRQAQLYPAFDEAIDWGLVVGVGYLFRCRRAPRGSSAPAMQGDQNEDAAEGVDVENGGSGVQRRVAADGGAAEAACKSETVMVILPGPSGVWARARAPEAASWENAQVPTYDQLLERVAIGVLASAAAVRRSAAEPAATRSDASSDSSNAGSTRSRIMALLPFSGSGSGSGGGGARELGDRTAATGDEHGFLSATVGTVGGADARGAQHNIALVDLPGGRSSADADAEVGWVTERDRATMCDRRSAEDKLPAPSVGTPLDTVVQPVCIKREGHGAGPGISRHNLVTVRVDRDAKEGCQCGSPGTASGSSTAPVKAYIIK
jgi:uncharacterized membrane protein YgcG